MTRRLLRFGALLILIAALGALQSAAFGAIRAVLPNLVLAGLIAVSFFVERILWYAGIVILGVLSVRFVPTLEPEMLVLGAIALAAYGLGARLPGRPFLNLIFLTAAGTAVWYLALAPSYIIRHPFLFGGEVMYNIGIGIIVFAIGLRWFLPAYEEKIRRRV